MNVMKVNTGVILPKLAQRFNAAGYKLPTTESIKTTLGDFGKMDSITQVMIIIIAFLFFVIFLWCYNKVNLNATNCSNLAKVYKNFPLISSINSENPNFAYKLRDYYIKTAYNSCSAGNFKNDFVNLCALKNCIKQGARCLDFEIYSLNNKPIIAVSSKTDYNIKGSYNSIDFSEAMKVIAVYAFSGNTCPNPNDPLLLHFRIMSNNPTIYDEMAMVLYDTLEDKLLGKKFSYESRGRNIGSYPLTRLMGKAIIMVDKANPLFSSTKINEYVNIASNSVFLRNLRYSEIKYCPDVTELINYNKQNMTITLPDESSDNKNNSVDLAMAYGCQMVGVSFQNFDTNMEYYTKKFDDSGSAFILKDEKYRHIPLFIAQPPLQDPNNSYETRIYGLPTGEDWGI